jgi:hypothetical protein
MSAQPPGYDWSVIIGSLFGLFALVYLCLWEFHPAFKNIGG